MAPRMMIVDDDRMLRRLVEKLAIQEGFECASAEGGAEAIALLETHERYDLILLDLLMPQISGFDVIDHLLGERISPSGRIVLLVSGAPEALFASVSPEVVHGILRKPIDVEEFSLLLREVRIALERGTGTTN